MLGGYAKTLLVGAMAAGLSLGAWAGAGAENPRPPMMGWASWNTYRVNISEELIKRQADAIVAGGFAAAGYRYVNIDDGWFGGRDKAGRNTVHAKRFPNGLKPVADYIHAKGLKAGIYSDAGENTCGWYFDGEKQAVKVGFYGHEEEDARLYFDEWGFDFVKVDFGGCTDNGNEAHVWMDPKERYTAVAKAIAKTKRGKDVLMNVCCWRFPGEWVSDIAASWRVSGDVAEKWESVKGIINVSSYLARFQKPGHYNDMDMLEVGRGMSVEEDKTHFGMWCMLASPLMIGCDLTTVKPETAALLKNPELIAIDQDPLCKQGEVIWCDSQRDIRIYAKPLAPAGSQTFAVALYNATDVEQEFWVQPDALGLYGELKRRDVFERKDLEPVKGPFSWKVPAHGTRIFILSASAAPRFAWRGFMLDEARHFFGKETVKAYLDRMAELKLNVFHWHLTDDQGWRIDIPGMPELVKYGAVRPSSPTPGNDCDTDDTPYGPFFYTVGDIREVIAHASARGITIVPEIDFPGHTRALLAAHPEHELQGWVTRRMVRYIASKGRRAIGWTEILAGGELPRGTVIQSWLGPEGTLEALKKGHNVILSPFEWTYFTLPEGLPGDPYKYRFWVKDKLLPASKVRAFDPHAGIPDEYRRQVLGAECCAWSETLRDRAELEYKTLHRLPAFAAALCEGPTGH